MADLPAKKVAILYEKILIFENIRLLPTFC
jgi:hypothetical protein